MRLNIDCELVKQLVSGQLPNKSRRLDELTHEPLIWQCDTGQWLSCFDSCQLTILWMANIKDMGLPRHTWDTPRFLLIVSPTLPVQSVDASVRTLGQSRDNQTKRGWPYSDEYGALSHAREGAPLLRYTTAVIFFWSIARTMKSVVEISDVSVECHLLLPLCFTDIL